MSTKNDATYLGKVYLVRIKETEDYSSDDVVLAIGHVGKDNVDYEDFRNIVTVLNEKGLWTPFLSTERASWSSIKNNADCKALNISGDPVQLLENVHTFKELLAFLYTKGLLDHPMGKDILGKKMTDKKVTGRGKLGKSSGSKTLEEATKDPSIGKQTPSVVIDKVIKQSADLNAFNKENAASLKLSQSLAQLTGVPGYSGLPGLPPPVAAYPADILPSSAAPTNSAPLGVPSMVTLPLSAPMDTGFEQLQQAQNDPVPGNSSGFPLGVVSPDGTVQAKFDPGNFNIDLIDNEIEALVEFPDVDGQAKASRYKSLCKTLRESLGFASAYSQKLLQSSDANELKLREFKAYSADEVVAGLRPTMVKIDAFLKQASSLTDLVKALDEKLETELTSVRARLSDVSGEVANSTEVGVQQAGNILRHLAAFGIVDLGSSFDIPAALKAVHAMLKDDIAPVFSSGRVSQDPNPTLVYVDGSTGQPLSSGSSAPVIGMGSLATISQPSVSLGASTGFVATGGILDIPEAYRSTAVNFLGSLAPQNNVPAASSQGFPFGVVTPSKTSLGTDMSVPPPPPPKRSKCDVSVSSTDAVRSLFQSFAPQSQQPAPIPPVSTPPGPPYHPVATYPSQFQNHGWFSGVSQPTVNAVPTGLPYPTQSYQYCQNQGYYGGYQSTIPPASGVGGSGQPPALP